MTVIARLESDGDLVLKGELHELTPGFDDAALIDDTRLIDDTKVFDDAIGFEKVVSYLLGIPFSWLAVTDFRVSPGGHISCPEFIEDGAVTRIGSDQKLTIKGVVTEGGL